MTPKTTLRIEAESRLARIPASSAALTPGEVQQALHELQVHHIELEMQNEELRRAHVELDAVRQRYFDLYDFAPVGYLTLSEPGRIVEANLTAATLLGVTRGALVKQLLSRFILKEDQDVYYRHRNQLGATDERHCCELRMMKNDAAVIWVQLESSVTRDAHGTLECRCVLSDITERKHTERELRKREELLNAIQHLSKVGGWLWDIEQQSMFWTEETYRIHDYALGSLGTGIQEHITKSLGCCDETDRPNFLAAFQRCAELGEPYDIEYPFTTASGRRLWLRTSAHAVWDGARIIKVVGNFIDITERKQTEQALREWSATLEQRVAERTLELHDSEARFRQLAEVTFEGIAISEGGILIDGNLRGAVIHGYELAEMLGRPLEDFVAPQSRAVITAHIRRGRNETYEYLGLRKDGSIFPAEVHGRTGIWQGRSMRISVMRDLTAAKAATAKLRAQQAELAHAQHLALISEVSAGIIHQLGQPLSAIGANLFAMTKLNTTELQHCGALEIIRDVESDVARMRDIVVHLRALANPMHPVRVPSDLNVIVRGVLPLLRQKAGHNQVRLEVDLGEDLPTVEADAVQLSQVILNLVRNAFEAAENCAPEQRLVVVSTRAKADHSLELCVRDAGTGIASETMSRLFSPFFSTKADGLGVGLRLSQTIVHAHRGSIEGFNNPDGVGATFRIVLPTPRSGKNRRAAR